MFFCIHVLSPAGLFLCPISYSLWSIFKNCLFLQLLSSKDSRVRNKFYNLIYKAYAKGSLHSVLNVTISGVLWRSYLTDHSNWTQEFSTGSETEYTIWWRKQGEFYLYKAMVPNFFLQTPSSVMDSQLPVNSYPNLKGKSKTKNFSKLRKTKQKAKQKWKTVFHTISLTV